MPGLVPGIHVFGAYAIEDVDGRDKLGHDEEAEQPPHTQPVHYNSPSATRRSRI